MKSWMTSLFGFLAAIGGILSQAPGVPDNIKVIAGIAGSVGVAGLGLAAKDNNVTGGTRELKQNDVVVGDLK